jgi:hypothetical protein
MADNRYANGKIYRLVNSVDSEEYVGSTCGTLVKRLYRHKTKSKELPNNRFYNHCGKVGWDKVQIVLVEEYACLNRVELEQRERYWIEELRPTLNCRIPTQTRKEYYVNNRDKFIEYNRIHREEKKEYNKKYYEENKEEERQRKREYQAKLRESNPEKAKQKDAERYAKNKDNPEYREKNRKRCAKWYAKKKAEREAST